MTKKEGKVIFNLDNLQCGPVNVGISTGEEQQTEAWGQGWTATETRSLRNNCVDNR